LAKANAMEFSFCPPAKAGGNTVFNFPIFNRNCLQKFIYELPPALAGDNK
jgi:hypothetical protein